MRIQEVMQCIGVSKKALQYYEDKGLIQVHKDESGYRVYDEQCIKQLWEIKVLRRLDFSIGEIESIMKNEQRETIFNEHFNEIDKRMTQCTIQKEYIKQLYEEIEHTDDTELLQDIDENIQTDLERNNGIRIDIDHVNKGKGLAILYLIFFFLIGVYLILSEFAWEKIVFGCTIIILVLVYARRFRKNEFLVIPRTELDFQVDLRLNKVFLFLTKWRKR